MSNNILVVVESPAKAKTIAKYLGPGYIVRATMGHIIDLAKGKQAGIGVNIEDGFIPNYQIIPDKKDKIAAIKDAAKQCESILLAADPDREGEAIAFHVAEQLKPLKKPYKRVVFREITAAGIKDGIKNPRDLDAALYDAQQARRVLDRIVGFMVSPILIRSLGENMSAGRVQSVALKLIVEREKEIETFIPEEYWNITATLAKSPSEDSFIAKYNKKIINKESAEHIKNDLNNSAFIITSVEAKEQLRNPFPPLTTSVLQQLASARLKFPAAKTMKAAQSLYESGYITYIRTDSTRVSPEAISMVRDWLSENNFDLPAKPNTFKSKSAAQDAHEAIRPTDVSATPDSVALNSDEKSIYKLVWQMFVASQMKPAIYDTLTVLVESSVNKHELKAAGRTLKYPGWLAITGEIETKKDEDGVKIPNLKVKDKIILVPPKVKTEQKFTKPPSRYSEGSLIKELEKKGIGRPSTYAAIMSKISSRNYIEKNKNQLIPTQIGRKVVESLEPYFLFMNYEYTANMEEKLDKIEFGKLDYLSMMTEFYDAFKNELIKARDSSLKDAGFPCDKCNTKMVVKHGKFGYYAECLDKLCKNTKSVELRGDEVLLKKNRVEVFPGIQCKLCGSDMVKRDGKFGPFLSCSTFPNCSGRSKIPYGKKCPLCSDDLYLTIYHGKTVLFCLGYPNCRHSEPAPTQINDPEEYYKNRKMIQKIDKSLKKGKKKNTNHVSEK